MAKTKNTVEKVRTVVDTDTSIDQKKAILKECISQTNGRIYNMEINLKVAKISDDKGMKEHSLASIISLLKQKDAYLDILKDLELEEIKS